MADDATNTGADGDTALTTEVKPGTPPIVAAKPDDDVKPAADPKATDDGKGTGANDDKGAQDVYADFVLPEGVTLDAELLDGAKPIFKELGLTKEQAQKLVDFQAKQVQANQQRQVDSFTQLKQDWLDQAREDKDIGGEKFDESIADAKLFIAKVGTPELKKLLNDYGVGNHPEVIRAFARAGKLMKEDTPGLTGKPKSPAADRASILYGTEEN